MSPVATGDSKVAGRAVAQSTLSRRSLTVGMVAGCLAPGLSRAGAHRYRAPRTANGQPNLQGIWTNAWFTRLERPEELKQLVITPEEARQAEAAFNAATAEDPLGQRDSEFWDIGPGYAHVRGQIRTSFIVDPADGRLPLRPEIVKRFHYDDPAYERPMDNPEDRTVTERCVASEGGYPPNLNSPDGNFLLIQQTRDHVVLLAEKYNDARVVRLVERVHAPAAVTSWAGDSVGWWDGDALVVETTNFSPAGFSRYGRLKLSADAKIVERFTRTGPGDLLCTFTVTDPTVYTQTWRAEMPYRAAKGPMYEYACHEGNYFLGPALAAARRAERETSRAK
jgi:hypothetical protein